MSSKMAVGISSGSPGSASTSSALQDIVPHPAASDDPLLGALSVRQSSSVTEKVKGLGSSIWNAISELWGKKQQAWVRLPGKWYEPDVSEKATGCFCALMAPHSQRENWNTVNSYVTEFWNTLSNVSFFAVGVVYSEPLIIVAAIASTLQHTFPKEWLVKADQTIATLATIAIGVRYGKGFYNQPETTIPATFGVSGTFALDLYNAQHWHYNFPHPLWHTACALGCWTIMQAADGEKLF